MKCSCGKDAAVVYKDGRAWCSEHYIKFIKRKRQHPDMPVKKGRHFNRWD